VDSELIKRPEINAITAGLAERVNSIIVSMNELRHDNGASFTMGDRLKSLEAEISELRQAAPIAPIAPLAPIAPVSPQR
jgi:hypothetical protein